jgi:uncharacterized membrane protein YtjA (UPF0391 family)
MLGYALLFFVLALAAAVLGFGGFVAGSLMWVAKVLFVLFIVLLIVALFTGRSVNTPPL